MRIWLDLANSPQVLFFGPLVRELGRRGHQIEITTRAYAQTIPLADQLGLRHTPIGRHGGRGLGALALENARRAGDLVRWARPHGFDLAVSHNSYSQVVAAKILGVPSVTLMDYEHQPLNHLCFRLARRVIVPEAFPSVMLWRYGALGKARTFPGVKEQLYLAEFTARPDFREAEGFPRDRALVVVRPPAPWTAYHRFENDLFDRILERAGLAPEAHVLFLPRVAGQAATVRGLPGIVTASKVYDGPNLLYHADVAISGGGTMNREAAVLGTRTYTVFKGKLGSVDRYLLDRGRMAQVQSDSELSHIQFAPRAGEPVPLVAGRDLLARVADHIVAPFATS